MGDSDEDGHATGACEHGSWSGYRFVIVWASLPMPCPRRKALVPEDAARVPLLHLQMICTREAGIVGAMIPDRIYCSA